MLTYQTAQLRRIMKSVSQRTRYRYRRRYGMETRASFELDVIWAIVHKTEWDVRNLELVSRDLP